MATMTTLVLVLAAFLLGLLWGGLHSVVWIQLTYPSLFAMARRARGELDRPLPGAMAPGALRNFAGSLFGTTATGGVFAFLGEGRLNLGIFAIGLCLGFAPALVRLLQKFVGYISVLVVIVALSAGLRSGAIDVWELSRRAPWPPPAAIALGLRPPYFPPGSRQTASAAPPGSASAGLVAPGQHALGGVEGPAGVAGGPADELAAEGRWVAAASDDRGISQLAEFSPGSADITKEMAQTLDRWCSRVGKLEKSRVVVEIRGRADKGEAEHPYRLGARRGKNVQAFLAVTCGLERSWVVSTGTEEVPFVAPGGVAGRAANRGVLLVAELEPGSGGAAAQAAAPEIRELLQHGRQLLSEGSFAAAADTFTRANEMVGGRCDECLVGVARAVRKRAVRAEVATGDAGEALSVLRGEVRRDPSGPLAVAARISLCLARLAAPVALPRASPGPLVPPRASPEPFDRRDLLPIGGPVQRPWKLYGPAPQYTEATRKARVQGTVILESVLDAEGCVIDARVLKAVHPELDRASLTAVRQWVFQPAELRGKPVDVFFDLTLSFQLGDSPPAVGGAAAGGGKSGS